MNERLSALACGNARTRARGVGVGELLGAHRALAAVDPSSREDARLALRAVLCSGRGDLERFERAFAAVFGEADAAAASSRSLAGARCDRAGGAAERRRSPGRAASR